MMDFSLHSLLCNLDNKNKKENVGMRNGKNSTESAVHDTDSYLQSLIATNPLQEPVMRRVVRALDLPPGSRGLDVGCGIGLQAVLLAEAVGAAGHVTGVDLSWVVREALQRRWAPLSRSPFGKGI